MGSRQYYQTIKSPEKAIKSPLIGLNPNISPTRGKLCFAAYTDLKCYTCKFFGAASWPSFCNFFHKFLKRAQLQKSAEFSKNIKFYQNSDIFLIFLLVSLVMFWSNYW
jgi:hypothetical protein